MVFGVVTMSVACGEPRPIVLQDSPFVCSEQCMQRERACSVEACCDCEEVRGQLSLRDTDPPEFMCIVMHDDANWDWLPGFGGEAYCEWAHCERPGSGPVDLESDAPVAALARERIAMLSGRFEMQLRWSPEVAYPHETNVPAPMTTFVLEMSYEGGPVIGNDAYMVFPEDVEPYEDINCRPEVDIQMAAHVHTLDGALDEQLDLQWWFPAWQEQARAEQPMRLSELDGYLEVAWQGEPIHDDILLELQIGDQFEGELLTSGPYEIRIAMWPP
jgi:hypothetical protein